MSTKAENQKSMTVPTWVDFPEDVTQEQADRAICLFAQSVRQSFSQNIEFFLVGSRARGDYRPDSDVDVAIVFSDGGWSKGTRIGELAELAFDVLMSHSVYIQPHPFSRADWEQAAPDRLICTMKPDAIRIELA